MTGKDDIQGLPNVDLSAVVDDLNKQNQQPQVQDVKQSLDLAQFKTPEDLLKSYKELQAAFTRVSQENKVTKEERTRLAEELELARLASSAAYAQPQYADPQQQFVPQQQQPGQYDPVTTYSVMRASEILEEEAEKSRLPNGTVNQGEFMERYGYAQAVIRQYPQLRSTGRGIKKAFELGDKLRSENLKRNAGKALESIFGGPLEEEEINKLRTFVKGDKVVQQQQNFQSNAYMPDTSTSTKSGSDQNQQANLDRQIKESELKGDVDGVIQGIFTKVLAE